MAKDLNSGQPVTDPEDLNKTQSVAATDLNQPVTGTQVETLADGDDKDKKTVKYSEFEKANEAKKTAEEALVVEKQKLEQAVQQTQMLVDQIGQTGQTGQATQPISTYDQAKSDLGLANEEYLTEAQRSQLNSRMFELQGIAYQQQAQQMASQQFVQGHPDCYEVVGSGIGTKNFRPSSELLEALNKQPHLTASAQTPEGAYKIVMAQRELDKLQKQNEVNEEHLTQNQIDTKLAPVSGAAAAGGAVASSQGVITLEQQQENERRVAEGEFNTKG